MAVDQPQAPEPAEQTEVVAKPGFDWRGFFDRIAVGVLIGMALIARTPIADINPTIWYLITIAASVIVFRNTYRGTSLRIQAYTAQKALELRARMRKPADTSTGGDTAA